MPAPTVRATSGQATVELTALVALLAGVLVLGAAAADGRVLTRGVHAGLVRALCVVTGGGGCVVDLQPCPTAWRQDARADEVVLSVLRLGREHEVLREDRSDGTVALTFSRRDRGGLSGALRRRAGPADVSVRATVTATSGGGATWVLPGARAADRLLAEVARRGGGARAAQAVAGPPATSTDEGTGTRLAVAASLDVGVVAGTLAGEVARVDAVVRDHRTGEVTTYLQHDRSAALVLGGARRRGRAGGGMGWEAGQDGATERAALVRAADGRPLRFALLRVDHGGAVPAEASAAAGLLPPGGGGRVVVTEAVLDLADPGHRAAVAAYLAPARRGRLLRAARELRDRLMRGGVLHVRVLERSRSAGAQDVLLGEDVRVVGWVRRTEHERTRLVGAATRDLGGTWGRRDDCLGR